MPITDYGVWKARVGGYTVKSDEDDRHLSLYCYDSPESPPVFDRNLRDHRQNIPGFFRVAINVASGDTVHSRLVYWVNRRFKQNPIVNQLARLSFGFHSLLSRGPENFGLDFIRGAVLGEENRRVLPRDIPGPTNDILDILEPEIANAIERQADVYVFGSESEGMMHNIHMNQGNSRKFKVEDGIYQDGGLVIHIQGSDQWIGIFLAFVTQAMLTDELGHAILPTLFDKPLSTDIAKSTSVPTSDPPGPARDGVRLLSLDGGGILGLSELLILEKLMRSIDSESPPKPGDVFDLICGSSVGGLVAIMLGRLRMSIDECIKVYIDFPKLVIEKPATTRPIDIRGRFRPRYNGESLEKAIKEIIRARGMSEDELLQEVGLSAPVTAVVAQRLVDSQMEMFPSYHSPQSVFDQSIRIWEAARATTAAPLFFEPVAIGPDQVRYINGGMGTNNPVNQAVQLAKDIWPEAEIACLVSVGSGNAPVESVLTRLSGINRHLTSIATEMEDTAQSFAHLHRDMAVDDRYFRFNVTHGLERFDDDESSAISNIMFLTRGYFEEVATRKSIERCAGKLRRHNRFIHEFSRSKEVQISTPPDLGGHDQSHTTRTESGLPEDEIMKKNIAECILTDGEMKQLIVTAYEKIGSSRLKRNLVILLEDFAQRLFVMELFGDLPNFIGSRAPGVVDQLFIAFQESSSPTKMVELPPSYEDAISARDEVQDLGSVERTLHILNQLQIKAVHDGFDSREVQQSKPFQQFCNDVRRFVFPSFKSYVQHKIGPHLRRTALVPIYSVVVCLDWELPQFLRTELGHADDMSQMITLTGTLTQAQAITCGDYMRQTWPQTGLHTLEAVSYALRNKTSYYQYGFTHSIQLEASDECLTAKIIGHSQEIVRTIEQFGWLASVFRFSEGELLVISEPEFLVQSGPPENDSVFAKLHLRPIQPIAESDLLLGSCWAPLFDRSVLAWGFPTADRGDLYGLELPFELLLRMVQTRFPVEFQKSIILRRESRTAFPVANCPVGTQWHVTDGGIEGFFENINSCPLLPVQDNLKTILEGRHFLGWVSRAQVKLGTEAPSDLSSGAPEETSRGLQLGEEVMAGLNIKPPWVGVNIGVKFIIPRAQTQRLANRQMAFEQLLEISARSPALYYDCETKTGWVVPELSLLFHIVCAYLLRYCAESDALHHIWYAERLSDGGNAALDVINSCGSTVLWKSQTQGGVEKNYCLRDLVQFYLDCFENRKEAIRLRLEHKELLPDLGLRGWDFEDLRDCTSFFRYRRIPPQLLMGRPDWWSLTKNSNIMVVLGRNLGQVIIPNRAELRPCSSWVEIPREHNLLVLLARCVEDMGRPWAWKRPRMHLSKKFCWHQPEDSRPFGDCLGHDCNPIQKLRDISGRNPLHGLRNPDGIPPDGAIIFGLPEEGFSHVESQEIRPCRPVRLLIHPPSQRRYLRTTFIGPLWRWILQLLSTVTQLQSYKPVIVSLSVIILIACAWIVVITWRP